MMIVMRKKTVSARAAAKEETHERIVAVAARAIRRSGYDGTGVADIMKEAGLTHGGFYSHFASREAMLAEAADRAGAESNALAASVIAAVPSDQALQALIQEVRRVTTRHIKEMVDLAARQSPDWGQPAAHERALVTVATMVGALLLARAVDDPALSDSLREAAVKHLLPAAS